MTKVEGTKWIGCGECDAAFGCFDGEKRCSRLEEDLTTRQSDLEPWLKANRELYARLDRMADVLRGVMGLVHLIEVGDGREHRTSHRYTEAEAVLAEHERLEGLRAAAPDSFRDRYERQLEIAQRAEDKPSRSE